MDTAISTDNKWRPVQAYILAAICLAVGLPLGYMIRGSAAVPKPAAQVEAAQPDAPAAMPTLDQMKHMADKKAEPLLAELKQKPSDAKLLVQTGNIYMQTHQFKEAADYFRKALQSDPKNFAVRADLASCLYYDGDPDAALAELQQNLNYDAKHAGTLLNIGIIDWKGKGDAAAAVATWQKLLKLNPNYERKDQVEHLIEAATQDLKANKSK
jgi:cytochrome c-type biogenesis protein CcmH/NrfG